MFLFLYSSALAAPAVSVIAAGQSHSCLLSAEGDVICWGGLNREALRRGDLPEGPRVHLSEARDIATGGRTATCAAREDGIWCWKAGGSPEQLLKHPGVRRIALGSDHGCAVLRDRVSCWGYNARGQVGDGTTETRERPVDVGLDAVIDIALGPYHSCALHVDGTVSCWGGLWSRSERSKAAVVARPVQVEGITGARQLAAGHTHTCALEGDTVLCWGLGRTGQLGQGDRDPRDLPSPVRRLPPVSMIAAGLEHTCALATTGTVHCWGANAAGQLGIDDRDAQLLPTLSPLDEVTHLSLGSQHSCGVRSNGEVWCWGQNFTGQLGVPERDIRVQEVPWR